MGRRARARDRAATGAGPGAPPGGRPQRRTAAGPRSQQVRSALVPVNKGATRARARNGAILFTVCAVVLASFAAVRHTPGMGSTALLAAVLAVVWTIRALLMR